MKKLIPVFVALIFVGNPGWATGPASTTARNLTDLAFCASNTGATNKTYKFWAAPPGTNNYSVTWGASNLPSSASLGRDGTLTMTVQPTDVGRVFTNIVITFADGVTTQSKAISITIRSPQTYYVAKNGADSNLGTITSPWLTIGRSVASVLPGDTVMVDQGIYRERVTTRGLTNGSDYLTFTTNGSGTVECMGFQLNNDFTAVNGFQITNAAPVGPNLPGINIDANSVRLVNNYLYNQSGRGFAISGYWYDHPQLAYVASNHIYHSQSGMYSFGFNWTVEWNEIERLYQYDTNYDSDYFNIFGEGHTFRYNYLHGTVQSEVPAAHVDCFQTYDDPNTLYWCANCIIEHNLCSDFDEGFIGEAQYLLKSRDIIIRNNVFHDGLPLDSNHPLGVKGVIVHDIPNVTVTNNTFYNITYGLTWSPTLHGAATNGVVKNNIMINTGYGYEFPTNSGCIGDYNWVYPGSPSYSVGPHDVYNKGLQFVNVLQPLGPDGIQFTSDDGFSLPPGSAALTAGENGTEMGAFADIAMRPQPPNNLRVMR